MNWYLATKTAAELNPDISTPWESDPDNPQWKQWQKFERQRYLSFVSEHDRPYHRQYKDPDAKMYGFQADDAPAAGANVYHVTTQLGRIKIDGQLKARNRLKDTMGLGYQPNYDNPTLVSCTYDLSRAQHIYEQLHFVANIIRGKILASTIYRHFYSHIDYIDEGLSTLDQVARSHGVPKRVILEEDEQKIGAILDKNIATPEDRYEFMQECESAVMEHEKPEDFNDTPYQQSVIGITTPFFNMKNLNPSQIAIIQCVLRKDADVEHIIGEMEIRVSPTDLAVIRYMQPNPGVYQ